MTAYAEMALQTVDNLLYNALAAGVNTTASLGNAAISDPLAAFSLAAGVAMIAAGASGEVGGVALDATGFGAVAGVPLNVASAGLIATGATTATVGGAALAESASKNQVIVMEQRSTVQHPDFPDRNTDGRFQRGNSGIGKDKEALGIELYKDNSPGRWVTTKQRKASINDTNTSRYYDELARLPDGTYQAIEVKSGTASLTPNQRKFDSLVSPDNPAYVTIRNEAGKLETVKITSVEKVRIP